MTKHPLSKSIERVSDQLDGLRFTGLDQNPKGIRDNLFCLVRKVKIVEQDAADRPELGFDPKYYPSPFFSQGDWDCSDSPTEKCMYTVDHDYCIFCSEPDERK